MKSNPLDHARHNERVCNFLDEPKNQPDWVVTTAFYSALHYVRHWIFPFEMEVLPNRKRTFLSFDDYYQHYHSIYPNTNKHEALKKLVRLKVPEIADNYDHLLDLSSNARYINYNLDLAFSKAAKKSLKQIKSKCDSPKDDSRK